MRQINIHLVVLYFDNSFGLEDGPNVQKTEEFLQIISAIKLPWLIVGDLNVTPEECFATSFFNYLGGSFLAPDVDFTCTSNGSDRRSDYAIASKDLAEYIQVKPHYLHPFRPHICGVDLLFPLRCRLTLGMF